MKFSTWSIVWTVVQGLVHWTLPMVYCLNSGTKPGTLNSTHGLLFEQWYKAWYIELYPRSIVWTVVQSLVHWTLPMVYCLNSWYKVLYIALYLWSIACSRCMSVNVPCKSLYSCSSKPLVIWSVDVHLKHPTVDVK